MLQWYLLYQIAEYRFMIWNRIQKQIFEIEVCIQIVLNRQGDVIYLDISITRFPIILLIDWTNSASLSIKEVSTISAIFFEWGSKIIHLRTISGRRTINHNCLKRSLVVLEGQKCNPNDQEKLRVIGAGLMRTGTTSLQIALEHLLERPCYHMSRVALQLREPTIRQWISIYQNNGKGIEEALEGYAATVDYPACAFYADLLEAHSNAKVNSIKHSNAT